MFGGSASEAEAAFEQFVAASWSRLRWSAYLLCGDHHLAEDLTQTALARTYGAWGRVRRDDALAYTRRTLVNANIDRLRRRRHSEVGDADLAALPAVADTGSEDRDEIVRLLQSLSEQERKVVVLRHYYDLSEAAVAIELGLPTGTVKSTLSRALAKLRVSAETPEPSHGRTLR
jgi:RNA polymerase sigma-70 factor (sigma-E family)